MGGFSLMDSDYIWVTDQICKVADEFAERVVKRRPQIPLY